MSDKKLSLTVVFGALDKLTGPLKAIAGGSGRAQKQLKAMTDEAKRQKAALDMTRASIKGASGNLTQLLDIEKKLASQYEQTNSKIKAQKSAMADASRARIRLEKLGGKLRSGGTTALGVGAAIEAPAALAAMQAMSFESSMADVKKVLSFTPAALKQLNSELLDMSTRVPMTAEGLAQIAAAAGRAGVAQKAIQSGDMAGARKELLQFTEDAAKMGIAFDMSAEDAGQTMAKWRTAFSMDQSGVQKLGDQINALTNRFGGSAGAVTDMVTRIGPLGKVAGVSAPQMAAMAQLLNSVGVESEIGATSIKNMMLALTKGSAASKQQQQSFAALGLSATEVAKRMQTDAGGAIVDVMKRLAKLPKDQQAGTLTNLFGSESVAGIAPMLTSLDQLQSNLKLVGDNSQYAGSMTNEFLSRIATTEGATGLAGNALKALNIQLGQALLPFITDIAQKLTPLVNNMRDWAEKHPQLTQAIVMFVAVGGGLLILLGGMAVAAGTAMAAFAALGITTWAALWPVLAVIAAIALLVAAGYLIYKNWDKIVAFFGLWWKNIKAQVKAGIDFVLMLFFNFTPLGILIKHWDEIMAYLGGLWDRFKAFGGNLMQGLIDGIREKLSAIRTMITDVAGKVVGWFKGLLGIHSPSRVFKAFGGFISQGLSDGISGTMHRPIRQAAKLAAGVAGAVAVGSFSPAASAGALSPGVGSAAHVTQHVTITIHAASGQSAQDIASAVAAELDRRAGIAQARANSAYRDSED